MGSKPINVKVIRSSIQVLCTYDVENPATEPPRATIRFSKNKRSLHPIQAITSALSHLQLWQSAHASAPKIHSWINGHDCAKSLWDSKKVDLFKDKTKCIVATHMDATLKKIEQDDIDIKCQAFSPKPRWHAHQSIGAGVTHVLTHGFLL